MFSVAWDTCLGALYGFFGRGLVNGCLYTFSIEVVWNAFAQPKLRYILCARLHGVVWVKKGWEAFCFLVGKGLVWSKQFELQFVSTLAREGFSHHKWETVFVFLWTGEVWSTRVKEYFVSSHWCIVDAFCVLVGMGRVWDTFIVFPWMVGVWSRQVKVHFGSSPAWEVLINRSSVTLCVFTGNEGVWRSQLEIHFCSRWHVSGLDKMC